MIDSVELAHAVGGVLVTAATHTVEVRMLDRHHVNKGTSQLKLPIVFKGTVQAARGWAEENGYKEVHDKSDVYGGHFQDNHGNAYVLT
jgi:hypothetical protein